MSVRNRLMSKLIAVTVGLALFAPAVPAHAAVRTFEASLSGADEVPGPGDPNGSGAAQVKINVRKERVCFTLGVLDITLPAGAAHIHQGAAGVAGDIVVTLKPPVEVAGTGIGLASGCVRNQARSLLRDIKNNPDQYYVNVHTEDFPDGAVRGQLEAV
jgi:CHRD domain